MYDLLMVSYNYLTKSELVERLSKAEEDKIKYVNKYLEQEEKWNILRLLFAKISHEFKTPLNSIIGFSDILRKYVATEKEISYLNIISTSSKHLLDLIQDLLDLTKAQYKPLELNYQKFNSREEIISVVNTFPNVKFDCTLINTEICADVKRFRQLIYNLVSNAVKFNSSDKNIQIITYMEDGFNFEITDFGDGIDKSNSKIIFEFFSQVNDDVLKRQMGSGIGLSLCKSIIDAHNGKISVDSELGSGSTFKFRLPTRNA